ncbi:MAG TPA: sialidase family protein [Acidimicrobiales bacterium]|nr:sialidase family protein [Acidimicrobiales bacterium]
MLKVLFRVGVVLGLFAAAAIIAGPADAGSKPAFTPITVTDGSKPVSGGEPTIGYDAKNDAVIFGASAHETRMKFDAKGSVTQTDVSAPSALTTLDSFTFTDRNTSRTFDTQLITVCSLMSYSDDAGASWSPSQGCGFNTLLDHESVGGGPFHAPAPVAATYPDAIYYCAQNGFNASCAVSLDGGVTFGPGSPISNTPANNPGDPFGGACSGLHGHPKVGPDGTAYVPIKGCGGTPTAGNLTNEEFFGGHPAVSVSTDNGTTWLIHTVPGGNNGDESDNAIDIDKGNRLYMGWQDATYPDPNDDTKLPTTSSAKTAYSDDDGKTWSTPVDLSSKLGVRNIQFPQVVAGDKGRAAIAFLGTNAIGDDQHEGFVGPDGNPAVWHLYVSLTYNGGKSWDTYDTTPNHPVQRGCVDLQGTSNKTVTDNNICSQRNLLDFNDITIDGQGRVLVAYAEACQATPKCLSDPTVKSTEAVDTVMRLTSGKGLIAAFDGKLH